MRGTSEITPLLRHKPHRSRSPDNLEDIESQKPRVRARYTYSSITEEAGKRIRGLGAAMNPRAWNKKTAWEKAVMGPMRCSPAVIVGLLLNILDALSYGKLPPRPFLATYSTNDVQGMILFPLGNPVFASLGPAGISIFYVSTIVSQLTFSWPVHSKVELDRNL